MGLTLHLSTTHSSTMLFLLPLLIMLAGADHHHKKEGCVEIHQWLDWEWNIATEEVCSYWCSKVCETKTEEVCLQVPALKCELVGYTVCSDTKEVIPKRNDTLVIQEFQETACSPGPVVEVTGTKQVLTCVDRVKEKCDFKWETDPVTQEKVWVGNVNCHEVTVDDCVLEDKEVVERVQTNDCKVSNTIQFQTNDVLTVGVPVITTKCEPKLSTVCSTVEERKCTSVTWESCTQSLTPWCATLDIHTPHQKEEHSLRCPFDHTLVGTTSDQLTATYPDHIPPGLVFVNGSSSASGSITSSVNVSSSVNISHSVNVSSQSTSSDYVSSESASSEKVSSESASDIFFDAMDSLFGK